MEAMHVVLSLVFIWITFLYSCECYYLSGSRLSATESFKFCADICLSEIASIHNQQEMDDAVTTIRTRPVSIWSTNSDAFIGLKSPDFPTYPYKWNDSTPFDFGNNTKKGIYPWTSGKPVNNECVKLQQDTADWSDSLCGDSVSIQKRFLCNNCNGVLNKYALISFAQRRTGAAITCSQDYGTSLASIHTERDYAETRKLWNIVSGEYIWIGMTIGNHTDLSTFLWDDGTPFDFGNDPYEEDEGCDPWSGSGPDNHAGNEDYVTMGNNRCWNDVKWDYAYDYVLCNLPSELVITLNNWQRISDGEWIYSDIEQVWTQRLDNDKDAEIVLWDKQWYNGHGPLLIDYMFSIDFKGINGTSGVSIYNSMSGNTCFWYYVGIEYDAVEIQYHVVLEYGNGTQEDDFYLLDEKDLSFNFVNGYYYTMSIKVTDGNNFYVSINDEQYISFDHNMDGGDVLNNGYSGYISLFATSGIVTKAKKLYISGTPTSTDQTLIVTDSCNDISITSKQPTSDEVSETDSPSILPTVFPTAISAITATTNIPTRTPIQTYNPSKTPTAVPTSSPTNDPSVPQISTEIPISSVSTDNPTNIPTLLPTLSPQTPIYIVSTMEISAGVSDTTKAPTLADEYPSDDSNSKESLDMLFIVIGAMSVCIIGLVLLLIYSTRRKRPKAMDYEHDMSTKHVLRKGLHMAMNSGSSIELNRLNTNNDIVPGSPETPYSGDSDRFDRGVSSIDVDGIGHTLEGERAILNDDEMEQLNVTDDGNMGTTTNGNIFCDIDIGQITTTGNDEVDTNKDTSVRPGQSVNDNENPNVGDDEFII